MPTNLIESDVVDQAKNGDKQALERIVTAVQGQVYNLAIRMLQSPSDAEDATQEILIKIITHLSDFRGESVFTTWVYRIATNHLLNMSTKRSRERQISFDSLTEQLETSLAAGVSSVEEQYDTKLLTEEVRRSCTLAMLLCLNRDQRIAIILGEIFELSSETCAEILDISPVAFRKRLSRARAMLVEFVSRRCGIINPASPCRCEKHIGNKIRTGGLHPEHLLYATTNDAASHNQYLLAQSQELSVLYRSAALFRAHPQYTASDAFITSLRSWLNNPTSHLLENAGRPVANQS